MTKGLELAHLVHREVHPEVHLTEGRAQPYSGDSTVWQSGNPAFLHFLKKVKKASFSSGKGRPKNRPQSKGREITRPGSSPAGTVVALAA